MYFIKLLINHDEGGDACLSILPPAVLDKNNNITSEVIQCTCLQNNGGCSMIRITDYDKILAEEITDRKRYETSNGECMIDRISNTQLIAMVMNNNCHLARIVSESGCFITSAVMESDGKICWTIIGPNSTYLHKLVKSLNENGYDVEKKSIFSANYSTVLSNKQEESIRLALENGFYDIPKKINMGDLSNIVGCSKSTLDVTLRNAEKKIISHYFLENRDTIKKG